MATQNKSKPNKNNMVKRFPFGWILAFFLFIMLVNIVNSISLTGIPKEISYSQFYRVLKDNPERIKQVTKTETILQGDFTDNSKFFVNIPENDPEMTSLMRQNLKNFEIKPPRTFWVSLLFNLGPILLLIFFWWMMAARGEQLGNRIMTFGKVKPKIHSDTEKATFNDVAGVDEAKEELKEVIEFLKDPKKFQRLGGKIPKGVLLVGPPGCGKCVTGNSIVLTNKGPLKIKDIPKYFYVDAKNKVYGAKVSSVLTNLSSAHEKEASHWYDLKGADVLEVRTRLGNSIKGTYEHPVLAVSDHGDLVFKRLSQLKIGDFVAIKYNNQLFGNQNSISESIAYILGLLTGDGCATIKNTISFSTADTELLAFIKDYFRREYSYEIRKLTGKYDYGICRQDIIKMLRDHGLNAVYAKDKDIPDSILQSHKPVVIAFLQGLFDTDGYVEKNRGCVCFSSSSEELVKFTGALLLNLGIVSHYYTRPIIKYNHLQYYLEISGDFLHNFAVEVGFRLNRKKEALKVCLERTRNTNINIIPNQGPNIKRIWQFLIQNGSKPSLEISVAMHKNILRYISAARRPSLSSLAVFIEECAKIDPKVKKLEEFQHLKQIVNSQLFFSPVVSIKKGKDAVYDFTVKETHNFIANGFVSHNTLIARAVAGEAEVPFFSISGSDFVEMFVGVGASRVRDLFDQGRKAGKVSGKGAIIFIDEIDAVGRLRFSGIGGGHDEREQTLNQLLVEMDGFDAQQGLILIAATNRPDTLDPALMRPGRFDRTIIVNFPDIRGREEILKVHTRKIKLSASVDLKSVATQTPGFSGADLANLCNEAALMAARNNKEAVEEIDLDKSVERVLMGPEKKSHIMSKKEKEITALHESGHALLSLLLPEVNPLKKVSIIPRGLAGGYTFTPPLEDRHYWTKKELLAEITMMLGGRASEEINLNEVTTGAQNDLEMATSMARRMIMQFGMSEKLGNLTLGRREGLIFLGRDIMEEKNYSEQTARIIDEEVKKITDDAYDKAINLLKSNQDKLRLLADTLIEKEVLSSMEVKRILGIEKSDLV